MHGTRWLCALPGLIAALAGPAQAAYRVSDDAGRTVAFDAPPQRIVSLLPSLTESVCEMGGCSRLVGVDRYSNWPASVTRLPQVGGGLDPHIEAVVALRPDAVLVATSSRLADRLSALGLKVVVLEPKTHADVRRVLGTVAAVLGQPPAEAERVWRHIDAAVSAAAQSLPAPARGKRVLFEVAHGPYAAGDASFLGETLTRLGMKNAVPASLGPFPRVSPEYVLRADPDLLMAGSRSLIATQPYPGWDTLRAVRQRRVCLFDAAESDTLVRPGPRMAEAARIMARCIASKLGTP